jgi:hypothetical protein
VHLVFVALCLHVCAARWLHFDVRVSGHRSQPRDGCPSELVQWHERSGSRVLRVERSGCPARREERMYSRADTPEEVRKHDAQQQGT